MQSSLKPPPPSSREITGIQTEQILLSCSRKPGVRFTFELHWSGASSIQLKGDRHKSVSSS